MRNIFTETRTLKSLFAIFLTIILRVEVVATGQAPDKIIYNGKEFYLLENPLENYFEQYPNKRPKGEVHFTGLIRGYIATFEIRESQLFLKDIIIQTIDTTNKDDYGYSWKSVLSEVFPYQENIKISWLTGIIFMTEIITTEPFKERYFVLKINKGDFIKYRQISARKYRRIKKRQFRALPKNDKFESE